MTGGAEAEARAFLAELERRAAPLNAEANRAWWDAATGGGEAALERSTRARAEYRALLSDPEAAARIRGWLASGEVADPLLHRQLVVLDLLYVAVAQRTHERSHAAFQRTAQAVHGHKAAKDGTRHD